MELKKLRSISERKEILSEGLIHTQTMVYVVGGTHPIRIENERQPKLMKVSSIEETEKHYQIYLKEGDEIQLWKEIPKNEYVTPEHFIS